MKLLLYIKIIIIVGFLQNGFSQNATKRAFSDTKFYYELEINLTNKKIKLRENKKYHWYKSNKIYANFYDKSGKLLHGNFQKKEIKTLKLVEKGSFFYGLKDGLWKEWFLNGYLSKVQNWESGLLHGKYETYNNKGDKLTKGNYHNGKKNGIWIDFLKKDTLRFTKGEIKQTKNKKSIKEFFNSIFRKKEKSNTTVKNKKTVSKKKKKEKKKKSFWYRLFDKKESKNKTKN